MRKTIIRGALMLLLLAGSPLYSQGAELCKPTNLRCEHLVAPLGIDARHPRLSWQLSDERQGAVQRAYRLLVSNDSLSVVNGVGDWWDTGRTPSDVMLVSYAGRSLQPFTRLFWKVVARNKDGVEAVSDWTATPLLPDNVIGEKRQTLMAGKYQLSLTLIP